MNNHITYNPKTREQVFTFVGDVQVSRFGKVKTVLGVELTPQAVSQLMNDPLYLFKDKEVLFIERVEDYYATRHFANKVGVRLTKREWS